METRLVSYVAPESMLNVVWVGLGGFVGANARYWLSVWIAERVSGTFPFATLLINTTGSLAIGFLLVLLTERLVADPIRRLLLVTGFLGGYTTFSSYTFEALTLARTGQWFQAGLYVLASNLLGLAAVAAGALLARAIAAP